MENKEDRGYWFTTKTGAHIHVEEGETPEQATEKYFGKPKTYPQNMPYEQLTNNKKSDTLKNHQEEEKALDDYIKQQKTKPKEKVIRIREDMKKWKKYDDDFQKYQNAEPKISFDMQEISKATGMSLIGFEYRLKGKDSYDRKVRDKYINAGKTTPIGDCIRYTFEHPMENAATAIKNNIKMIESKGYTISQIDNKWKDDGAYNGINVNVISPDGVPLEVQYITPENMIIKNKMHKYYEISRDSQTPEDIKKLADIKMKEISKQWERPKGIEEV